MRSLRTPLCAAALAITACSAAPGPAATVVVAPVESTPAQGSLDPSGVPLEPVARPGSARRFVKLAAREPGAQPVRVALDVPAAWGMRVREAGGRALRPCEVSPSSPSELFLGTRPRCDSMACVERDELSLDLERAGLVVRSEVDSATSDTFGPGLRITRIAGAAGSGRFTAFRLLRVDPKSLVPVACEAFLFADERSLQTAYEVACSTLRLSPDDWQEGPEEIAPAPDGNPRSPKDDLVVSSAVGYVSALASRDPRTAALFLLTGSECVASGGAPDTCQTGMDERRSALSGSMESVPTSFLAGAADVRYPTNLPGLAIATVKRRGDPCGPGYEITLAPGQKRYAVVSPEPMPDPRLSSASR